MLNYQRVWQIEQENDDELDLTSQNIALLAMNSDLYKNNGLKQSNFGVCNFQRILRIITCLHTFRRGPLLAFHCWWVMDIITHTPS